MKPTRLFSALPAVLLFVVLTASARADYAFTVVLNVSALNTLPNAPFSLDFQLAQGSGKVTNTVNIFNFSFVGGSPAGTPDWITGGATGWISSSTGNITLTNSSNTNEFAEEFSAGVTQISFNVDETTNPQTATSGTPVPDQLNIAVLNADLDNVPTTDPTGYNTLVTSKLVKSPTVDLSTIVGAKNAVTIVTATPEPASVWLGLIAALGMFGLLRLRSRRA
jgi:hypothetical protein